MFLCDPYHLFLLKIKSKSAWELCKAVICPYVLLVACSRGKEEGAEGDSEHIPQPLVASRYFPTAANSLRQQQEGGKVVTNSTAPLPEQLGSKSTKCSAVLK